MAAWGYEFYLLVLKVSLTSVRSTMCEALEDKIRIPARPCNILYFSATLSRHFRNEMENGAEMNPAVVCGIVTGNTPVSYWPIFFPFP